MSKEIENVKETYEEKIKVLIEDKKKEINGYEERIKELNEKNECENHN